MAEQKKKPLPRKRSLPKKKPVGRPRRITEEQLREGLKRMLLQVNNYIEQERKANPYKPMMRFRGISRSLKIMVDRKLKNKFRTYDTD